MERYNERTAAGEARDAFVKRYEGNDRLRSEWKKIIQQLKELGDNPDPAQVVAISRGKIEVPILLCYECSNAVDELVLFKRKPSSEDYDSYPEYLLCRACLLKAFELSDSST